MSRFGLLVVYTYIHLFVHYIFFGHYDLFNKILQLLLRLLFSLLTVVIVNNKHMQRIDNSAPLKTPTAVGVVGADRPQVANLIPPKKINRLSFCQKDIKWFDRLQCSNKKIGEEELRTRRFYWLMKQINWRQTNVSID